MNTLSIYLNFNGNCLEAFEFYKSVLGGEFPMVSRFKDIPPSDDMPAVEAQYQDRIMHITLPISNGTCIMGSDVVPGFGPDLIPGNNFSIALDVPSRAEAERVFNGLSVDGQTRMPLADTFWGAYYGMWVDKFGITWAVNYDDPAKVMQH